MDSRLLKLLPATLLLLALAGCQFWTLGGGTFTAPKNAFSVRVPAGWSYSGSLGSEFVATRDGVLLQSITIRSDKLAKALPNTERELSANLSGFELAETIAGDLRSDRNRIGLTVVANEPATLDGQSGCKLTLAFTNADQLRLTETRYCVVQQGKLWTLSFLAPHRFYYDRDLPVFEALVSTFRFGAAAAD